MRRGLIRVSLLSSFLCVLLSLWLARASGVDDNAASQAREIRSVPQPHSVHVLPRGTAYDVDQAIGFRDVLAAYRYRQELRTQAARETTAALHRDFWLHAAGSQLYTAWGAPITLKALNWYGFEYAPFVPDGLDRTPLDTILAAVRSFGFNALRLTFANEMVESNPVVTTGLDANPGMRGRHALDIMQQIIERAHYFDLRVILVDSRSEAGRGPELVSGMWYTQRYPEAAWIGDWETLVRRFRNLNAFVGADLRNEPHIVGGTGFDQNAYFNNGPLWGAYQGTYYHDRDWHYAAQTLGNDLLSINPHVLIIVEGVQMYLDPDKNVLTGGLWGSNLIGVQYDPIVLTRRSQLVYSVHEYGPAMWQGDWFNPHTTYASLAARWDQLWGYLLNARAILRAPIFVGEFGTCNNYHSCVVSPQGWKQGFWFQSFVRYLHEHPQVGWAYWALNPTGPFHPADLDFYSLVSPDWRHYYPLLTQALAPLLGEADGVWNARSAAHISGSLTPVPGCVPNGSCVTSVIKSPPGSQQASPRPASPIAVRVTYTVPYVQPADRYRLGDLYLPQGRSPARPAVVLVHGRTWSHGQKGTPAMQALARALAWHGYVTYDIAYRLTGEGGGFPADVRDVKDAIAYLTVNARRLNIDPTKIGVAGSDAGAYLALMAAYTPNAPPFRARHYPNVPEYVAAAGSFFAPVKLSGIVQKGTDPALVQEIQSYLGDTYGHNPHLYENASPITYVNGGTPTIFYQGTADPSVPFAQTYEMYLRLRERSVQSSLIDLPGAPHGIGALQGVIRDAAIRQLTGFLDTVFYQRPWRGGH